MQQRLTSNPGPELCLETCKKGPTLEVWVVFPPPKFKSGIRDMNELLERESRERENLWQNNSTIP